MPDGSWITGRAPGGGAGPPADEADQGGQGAAVGGQAAPLGDEAPAAGPGRAGRLMRVATFNVKHGENGHGGVDLRRLASACTALSADVLAIQEVDRFARRTHFRDEMRVIARATGLQAVFGEAARRKWRSYGNVLLARGPISDVEVVKLPRPSEGEPRVAIVARVCVDGLALSVGATHLSFRKGEGAAQLEVLLAALAGR